MKVRVQNINNRPAAVINSGNGEEIFTDIQYCTYHYSLANPKSKHLVSMMAENGTKTFGFVLNLSDYPQHWTDPAWIYETDELSLGELFGRIEMTLGFCPDAKFIIRFYCGAPKLWLQENPGERALVMKPNGEISDRYAKTVISDDDKDYVSLSSDVWRDLAGNALKRLIKAAEEKYGDHIIAYCLSGMSSEEWYHHCYHCETIDDYSEPARRKFTTYLQKKYGTDNALSIAWNDPDASFETVSIPVYSERISNDKSTFLKFPSEAKLCDYQRFYDTIIPDTISALASFAKKGAPDKLIGCLYAYQLEFGELMSGHGGLGLLLRDPNIDYIMIETGYANRKPGTGGENFRCPYTSVLANNKILINDNDTISYKFDEIYPGPDGDWKEIYRIWQGYADNPEISGQIQKRIVGFAFCNGMITTFFDLHGGYYDDEIIKKDMREAEKVYRRSFERDRSGTAEILAVFDEESDAYVRITNIDTGNPLLRNELTSVSANFSKLGAPYDFIYVEDLDKINLDSFKCVIVVNVYAVNETKLALLEKLKGGGRTVFWGYAPALFEGFNRNIKHVSKLTGINIVEGDYGKIEMIPTSSGHELVDIMRSEMPDGFESEYLGERFFVEDLNAKPIATLRGDYERITAAVKDFGDWRSVYISATSLPANVLKEFARYCGVSIYSDRFDTIFASRSFVVVHANGDGDRKIMLGKHVKKVTEPISGCILAENTDHVNISMKNAHTLYMELFED